MRIWVALISFGLAVVWLGGCVVSGDTQGGGGSGSRTTARGGNASPIMEINGQPISASDLIKSPLLRGGLRQYIFYNAVQKVAAERDVTVDPADINEKLETIKTSVIENGEEWEFYLSEQSITEEEFIENLANSLLFDALVEEGVDLSEAKLRELWESERTQVINDYMRTNHYPDSMRASVTFEDCRQALHDKILRRDGFPVMDELNKAMLRDSEIKLLCLDSEQETEKYEYLILEIVRDQLRRQDQALAEQREKLAEEGASPIGQLSVEEGLAGAEDEAPPAGDDAPADAAEEDAEDAGSGDASTE